jgi:hypothetical protein
MTPASTVALSRTVATLPIVPSRAQARTHAHADTHLGAVRNVATVRDSARRSVAAGRWRMTPATQIQTGYLIASKPSQGRREGLSSAVANPRHWSGDDFMGSARAPGQARRGHGNRETK